MIYLSSYHQGVTMDVILLCAFGIQADAQNNPDEPAITAAKRLINGSSLQRTLMSILSLLPFGNKISEWFPSFLLRDIQDILDISQQIVAAKKSAGSTPATRQVNYLYCTLVIVNI